MAKVNTVTCEFVKNRRGERFCIECIEGVLEVHSRILLITQWTKILNDMFCEKKLFVWKMWVDRGSDSPEELTLERRMEMLEEGLDVGAQILSYHTRFHIRFFGRVSSV